MAKATKSKEKHVTFEDLKKAGIPVATGRDYGLHKIVKQKPKSIEEVRKALSKIKGSLSDDIIRMRDEG